MEFDKKLHCSTETNCKEEDEIIPYQTRETLPKFKILGGIPLVVSFLGSPPFSLIWRPIRMMEQGAESIGRSYPRSLAASETKRKLLTWLPAAFFFPRPFILFFFFSNCRQRGGNNQHSSSSHQFRGGASQQPLPNQSPPSPPLSQRGKFGNFRPYFLTLRPRNCGGGGRETIHFHICGRRGRRAQTPVDRPRRRRETEKEVATAESNS